MKERVIAAIAATRRVVPGVVKAIDPRTGLTLRDATEEERAAYFAQPCRHPSFRKPVLVGSVLVDENTGPGIWFGGAGF